MSNNQSVENEYDISTVGNVPKENIVKPTKNLKSFIGVAPHLENQAVFNMIKISPVLRCVL